MITLFSVRLFVKNISLCSHTQTSWKVTKRRRARWKSDIIVIIIHPVHLWSGDEWSTMKCSCPVPLSISMEGRTWLEYFLHSRVCSNTWNEMFLGKHQPSNTGLLQNCNRMCWFQRCQRPSLQDLLNRPTVKPEVILDFLIESTCAVQAFMKSFWLLEALTCSLQVENNRSLLSLYPYSIPNFSIDGRYNMSPYTPGNFPPPSSQKINENGVSVERRVDIWGHLHGESMLVTQ